MSRPPESERGAGPGAGTLPPLIDPERRAAVLSSLMLVLFLAALDSAIVATALPTIVGELGGLSHLSWVVTAYLVAQTIPRRERIGELLADWSPDEHRQVAELLRRYASDVPEEAPAPGRS